MGVVDNSVAGVKPREEVEPIVWPSQVVDVEAVPDFVDEILAVGDLVVVEEFELERLVEAFDDTVGLRRRSAGCGRGPTRVVWRRTW